VYDRKPVSIIDSYLGTTKLDNNKIIEHNNYIGLNEFETEDDWLQVGQTTMEGTFYGHTGSIIYESIRDIDPLLIF